MEELEPKPELSEEMPEPTKTAVISVDFKEGSIIDKAIVENEGGIPKVFRELAKFARKTNVTSVIVLTIDKDNHVDYVSIADNEHHLALAALCMDDLKSELKDKLFGLSEEEEE